MNRNRLFVLVLAVTSVLPAACTPAINEFVANHTGADNHEYVEFSGVPNTDYSMLTLLQVEGDGAGAGVIDSAIPLGTTDANGIWWTGFLTDHLENGSMTLLLVQDFSGAPGNDLDANNDGVLDNTPWSTIADCVAVTDGGANDRYYCEVVLDSSLPPAGQNVGGASRVPHALDTDMVSDWRRNDFDGAGIPGYPGSLDSEAGEVLNSPGGLNGPDCNNNGVPDLQDIATGFSADCNASGTPDECEIANGSSADCQPNGAPDECETNAIMVDQVQLANLANEPVAAQRFDPCFPEYNTKEWDDFTTGSPFLVTTGRAQFFPGNWPGFANAIPFKVEIAESPGGEDAGGVVLMSTIGFGRQDGSGIVDFDFDAAVLPPGTWWLSVQAQAGFCEGAGQVYWFRANVSAPNGSEHYFHNPGGAFGFGTSPVPGSIPFETPADLAFTLHQSVNDSNTNGVPDDCEVSIVDCNGNGVADGDDLAMGTSQDCQFNGIPDECDLAYALDFAPAVTYPTDFADTAIAAADWDGDFDLDLAVSSDSAGFIMVLKNNSDGSFAPAQNFDAGGATSSITPCDGSGDLLLDDILVTLPAFNQVAVLVNDGSDSFGPPVIFSVGDWPADAAVADFNGDSFADAVTANLLSDNVSVLTNDGGGSFGPAIEYAAGDGPIALDAADLDGDFDEDLAIATRFSDKVVILLNNGDGTFAPPTFVTTGVDQFDVIASDLDSDNDADLAVARRESNVVVVLLNDGSGGVGPATDYGVGGGAGSLTAGDLDGDGDIDLATANNFSGDVSVLRNNGDGTFAAAISFDPGGNPIAVTAADLNADGLADLSVTGAPDVSVLVNESIPPLSQDTNTNGVPDECELSTDPPQIVQQPVWTPVQVGESALLEVAAMGAEPLAYQWFHGGQPVAGANSAMLLIEPATFDQRGNHYCEVSNAWGTARSHSVKLDVYIEGRPPVCDPGCCFIPDPWKRVPVPWNRDVDLNKIDDLIDAAPEGLHDIIIDFRSCIEEWHLQFLADLESGVFQYKFCAVTAVAMAGVSYSDINLIADHADVALIERRVGFVAALDVGLETIRVTGPDGCPPGGESVEECFGMTGAGVNVVVMDTGVDDPGSPGFEGPGVTHAAFRPAMGGFDVVNVPWPLPAGPQPNPDDDNGHGTHVASVTLGRETATVSRGVAPEANLIDVKVLDATGYGETGAVMYALDRLIGDMRVLNTDVINMSFSALEASNGVEAFSQMINRAVDLGHVVVAAASAPIPGDPPTVTDVNFPPASADLAIAVTAFDDMGTADPADDALPGFAMPGPRMPDGDSDAFDELKPEVAAPGVGVFAASFDSPDGGVEMDGTSMSSAFVSGLAALAIQSSPQINAFSVRQGIIQTAYLPAGVPPTPPGTAFGWNDSWGFGRVDAYSLLDTVGCLADPRLIKVLPPPPNPWDPVDPEGFGEIIAVAPFPPVPNAPQTITVRVDNPGPFDAEDVWVKFGYYSYTAANVQSYRHLGTNVISVPAGEEVDSSFTWTYLSEAACLKVEIGYRCDTNFWNNEWQRNIHPTASPVAFEARSFLCGEPVEITFVRMNDNPDWDLDITPPTVTLGADDAPSVIEALPIPAFGLPDGTVERIQIGAYANGMLLGGVIVEATMHDCNGNGFDDWFDIADGTSTDTDTNGIPDECETMLCAVGDLNLDRSVDGDDVPGIVTVFFAGPDHANFCQVDANANDEADAEDIELLVDALLTWPDPVVAGGTYTNIKAGCDNKRRIVVPCTGPEGGIVDVAIRAADKDENPSTCPVYYQLRTCDGVDVGEPAQVEAGATVCVNDIAVDRQLVVWCSADPHDCKISYKYTTCP